MLHLSVSLRSSLGFECYSRSGTPIRDVPQYGGLSDGGRPFARDNARRTEMALAILEDLEEEDVPQSSASTMPDLLSKWQPADAQQESLSSEEMVQQYILQNLPPDEQFSVVTRTSVPYSRCGQKSVFDAAYTASTSSKPDTLSEHPMTSGFSSPKFQPLAQAPNPN